MAAMMRSVYSESVNRIGHDPEKNDLVVEWKNGKTSIYAGVPGDLAEEIRNSWSIGTTLREQVINKFNHRYADG